MSKKTTDQLIEWLSGQVSVIPHVSPVVTRQVAVENAAMLTAIKAKLRAADKLCEDAKKLGWMKTVYPHIDLSAVDKAIKDYEEA